MTKRACPFETHIFRQSKIHVNNFKNDLSALKDIHDRTLKKLVEGSRKINLPNLDLNDNLHEVSASSLNGHVANKNFMQKYVTNYFTVNGKKILDNSNKVISSPEVISKCFFCDQGTNSTYQCVHCLEFYCGACSFVNYESIEDNRICISCS